MKMKFAFLLLGVSLLFSSSLLSQQSKASQELSRKVSDPGEDRLSPKSNKTPLKEPVFQLTPAYVKLIQKASNEFQQRNWTQVMSTLDQADEIKLDTPVALNLRGAVYTEQKEFEKADEMFRKALEQEPQYFAAQFNRGEVLFLQKKYPEARRHFEKMLEHFKDNELLVYKIVLTYLQEDNFSKAEEWKEKIKFPSDTPAYYFANAAVSFKQGNLQEAAGWIESSGRVFEPENNQIFLESLIDLGYIQRQDSSLPKGEASAQ